MATAYHLFHGLFADQVNACLHGQAQQRAGVAAIAAEFMGKEEYAERCRELVSPLLVGQDSEVSEQLGKMFQQGALRLKENAGIIRDYVTSPLFHDGLSLFHELKEHTGSLLPYSAIILAACESVATRQNSSSRLQYHVGDISELLLRLYDEANDSCPEVFQECLDAWDMLFECECQSKS